MKMIKRMWINYEHKRVVAALARHRRDKQLRVYIIFKYKFINMQLYVYISIRKLSELFKRYRSR